MTNQVNLIILIPPPAMRLTRKCRYFDRHMNDSRGPAQETAHPNMEIFLMQYLRSGLDSYKKLREEESASHAVELHV